MTESEKQWTEEAVRLCENAKARGVVVMFIRKQDGNDEADIIVTNTGDAKLVAAMNGNYEYDDDDDG